MAELLTTYDPKDVRISWNTIDISKGLAPDTFITVSRSEDGFAPTVGADGTVARTRNANKMGTVEITLMQNSPVNNAIAALALLDENVGVDEISNITITDPSGSIDFVLATKCWVRKIADAELGADYGTRTWAFDSAELKIAG